MQFTLGVLSGIVAGVLLLVAARRGQAEGGTFPTWAAWLAVLMGVVGAVSLLYTFVNANAGRWIAVGIFAPFATTVFAGGMLLRGDKRWQTWLALVLALLPVLFWVYFVIGEIVSPH